MPPWTQYHRLARFITRNPGRGKPVSGLAGTDLKPKKQPPLRLVETNSSLYWPLLWMTTQI